MDTQETIQVCYNKKAQPEEVDFSQKTLTMLKQVKFPVLIGIWSTQTCYDRVIVIWNGIVIDYESMYTYPLTKESLTQVCGTIITFQKVTSGYGLFTPKNLRKNVNELHVTDWGITELYKRDDNKFVNNSYNN